eukprot:TRINITY_DN74329_c0_g1_i1.p1 TRINITY_DN74329_c0_g1~~TRINITY_DN74329_c0_g1_i1.p1  ORF type:complete len:335 (-),score=42.63 TRINITY_DN74329_c0_g1_i1:56-1060(-)
MCGSDAVCAHPLDRAEGVLLCQITVSISLCEQMTQRLLLPWLIVALVSGLRSVQQSGSEIRPGICDEMFDHNLVREYGRQKTMFAVWDYCELDRRAMLTAYEKHDNERQMAYFSLAGGDLETSQALRQAGLPDPEKGPSMLLKFLLTKKGFNYKAIPGEWSRMKDDEINAGPIAPEVQELNFLFDGAEHKQTIGAPLNGNYTNQEILVLYAFVRDVLNDKQPGALAQLEKRIRFWWLDRDSFEEELDDKKIHRWTFQEFVFHFMPLLSDEMSDVIFAISQSFKDKLLPSLTDAWDESEKAAKAKWDARVKHEYDQREEDAKPFYQIMYETFKKP